MTSGTLTNYQLSVIYDSYNSQVQKGNDMSEHAREESNSQANWQMPTASRRDFLKAVALAIVAVPAALAEGCSQSGPEWVNLDTLDGIAHRQTDQEIIFTIDAARWKKTGVSAQQDRKAELSAMTNWTLSFERVDTPAAGNSTAQPGNQSVESTPTAHSGTKVTTELSARYWLDLRFEFVDKDQKVLTELRSPSAYLQDGHFKAMPSVAPSSSPEATEQQ